jgi:hypothetical protein
VPHGAKDATTSTQIVEEWWTSYPQLNIGIATANLLVIDVDPRHSGDESLAALEERHDVIPHTWCVRTGSAGLHIYLAAPSSSTISNSAGKLGPGLDIRATGGYVIAPPSKHISGSRYEWIFNPDEAPLATIPDWLTDKLTPQTPPIYLPKSRASFCSSANADVRITRILVTVARAQQGERNQLTFWAACTVRDMVREGVIDHAAGMDALIQLRQAATHAGLTTRETASTISSALRRSA